MASNPDSRPMPDGWIQQYNAEHQAWFYVNTKATAGPQSQWTHPADDQPIYAPPPGAPPLKSGTPGTTLDDGDKGRGASDSYYQSGSGSGAGPASAMQGEKKRGFGGLLAKFGGGGGAAPVGYGGQGYAGYQQQVSGGYGGYPQQPQQYAYGGYQQQPTYQRPQKAGMGVGGAAALGVGGGLLGGMMIGEMLDDDHGFGGGGGGGGDDFGGGDMGDMGGF